MHTRILSDIGQKIRKVRKEKGLTVQEIADRAGVSKGLISRIENHRTVPSLPVLISIIKALEVNIAHFFKNIDALENNLIIIKRKSEIQQNDVTSEEPVNVFPIHQKGMPKGLLQTAICTMNVGNAHPFQTREGFVLNYILEGRMMFCFKEKCYSLEEGDSIFFDGRQYCLYKNEGEDMTKFFEVFYYLS